LKLDYDIRVYKRLESGQAPKELKQIHPLGKLPVLEIEAPGLDKPLLLAESGTIVEYLADHFGTWLIPKRYPDGKDGDVGAETEAWLRYRVSS
jgi:glutathione S-transferase